MDKLKLQPDDIDQIKLVFYATPALSFIFSVVYNYCFFLGIRLEISKVPFNISDIAKSFFLWLPVSLPSSILMIAGAKAGEKIADKVIYLEEKLTQSTTAHPGLRINYVMLLTLLCIATSTIVSVYIIHLMITNPYHPIYLVAYLGLSISLSLGAVTAIIMKIVNVRSPRMRKSASTFMLFISFMALAGYADGHRRVLYDSNIFEVQSNNISYTGDIIRMLNSVLILKSNKKMFLIPFDEISIIIEINGVDVDR